MRGHDITIWTDGEDIPLVTGLTLDGCELLVPRESQVTVGADASGTLTVTFTVFAREIHTSDGP